VRNSEGTILLTGVIEGKGKIRCCCCDAGLSHGEFKRCGLRAGAGGDSAPGASVADLDLFLCNGQTLRHFVEAINSGFVQQFKREDLHRSMMSPSRKGKGTLAMATASWKQKQKQDRGPEHTHQRHLPAATMVAGHGHGGGKKLLKKCAQLLTELDRITGGCCLCHIPDFNRDLKFDANTVILCDQCEREFHVGCLKKHGMCSLKAVPRGAWFCSSDCRSVQQRLEKTRKAGRVKVKGKRHLEFCVGRGRDSRLLKDCLGILRESFDPLPHAVTGEDLLPIIASASSVADHDYTNVHTVLLYCQREAVCAACVRICGPFLAEIPFVATKGAHRGKGLCRQLFACLENWLREVGVAQMVLPSTWETLPCWKGIGFKKMSNELYRNIKADFRIQLFPGTTFLIKDL